MEEALKYVDNRTRMEHEDKGDISLFHICPTLLCGTYMKQGESGEVYSITRGAAYHQLLCNVCINTNNV